jgi:hypothetical protein
MNTTDQPQNQTPDTASNGNNPTRTRAGSRITPRTVAEIARICALSHSEAGACRLLNIRPQSWFSWKSRHKRSEKFGALLDKFRAGRIHDLITQIETAGDVDKAKAAGVRFDWRAAAYLLALIDPQRFSTSRNVSVQVNAPQQNSMMVAYGGEENLRKLIAMWGGKAKQAQVEPPAPPAAVVDCPPVQSLPEE